MQPDMAHDSARTTGLRFWSDQPAPGSPYDVDIIAVQGLGAHPYYTWVHQTAAQESKKPKSLSNRLGRLLRKTDQSQRSHEECNIKMVMWLRDLLVPEFKSARIATYSYESDWKNRQINTSLRECGQQLLEVVLQHRQSEDECERPLLLIGHSLGGLVIQQALTIAAHGSGYTNLRLSVAGIIFLGTPFQGSNEAVYANWVAKLVRLQKEEGYRYTLLETVQKDSSSLHALSIDFWRSYGNYDIVCFYENREADYGPISRQIVSTQSATLVGKKLMYMNADHSGLNKFSGIHDENFTLLLPELRRIIQNGYSIVADRHRAEHADLTGNVHWIVPRAVNSLFTGRKKLIDRMREALRNDDQIAARQKRIVITGLGGMGKSEVCLQVADLVREDFWGVFWVDVGTQPTAKTGFVVVAKVIGSSAETIDDSLIALAGTKRRWLLILDNADDPRFDYNVYIPSGAQGVVIITSRVPQCSQYSTVPAEALEGLDPENSTQLLLKAARVPEERWECYNKLAQDIVHLLGSHTLALIQAGAYIAEGYCRLDQYPERYQKQRKRLLEYYPDQEQSRYRGVYATFEASANILECSNDETAVDALDLLAILAMLHSSVLPLQIFAEAWKSAACMLQGDYFEMDENDDLEKWHLLHLPQFINAHANEWDDYRLKKACALLASLSLVTRHCSDDLDGVSMHPLAHAWARDRLQKLQKQQAWLSTGCVFAFYMFNKRTWRLYERELQPHVQSFLEPNLETVFSLGPQKAVLIILLECGWALHSMREDATLQVLLAGIFRELQISPENPNEEHVAIWKLAASNLEKTGRIQQAVALLEHVVKVEQTTLSETLLVSQHALAITYEQNQQTKKAIELLEHIAKVEETTLTETHPDRLSSQHSLAIAYNADRQTRKAIELLEHIVRIEETTLTKTHPDRLGSQHALAIAYNADGQTRKAIELLEHIVKIRETTLTETHPNRLASQHALAIAYNADGQTRKAIGLIEHVVRIRETTLTETHPNRLGSQHVLAIAYDADGQTRKAIELLEHIVKIRETTLTETHPNRLASQHALAIAYNADGQTRKAIGLLEHVVRIRETTLTETHPNRLASQHALAIAYNADGQTRKAIGLLEHVVAVESQVLEDDNPSRLTSIKALKEMYAELAEGQD